jgi:hypothetical protein
MSAPLPFLLLAALPAQEPGSGEAADAEFGRRDGVLFILNEEVVTESEVAEDAMRLVRLRPSMPQQEALSAALYDRIFDLIALEGFRRLGLDQDLMAELVGQRIQDLVEERGSRAGFDQWVRALGYNTATFRIALETDFVRQTWSSIVTGEQPSPLQGKRNQILVTPTEIREEYGKNPETWKQAAELVWTTLQFFDSERGSGIQRAAALVKALRAGETAADEALSQADNVLEGRGDPARRNLRSDLAAFLAEAQPGEVSEVDPIQGLGAQIVVLRERLPAREIGFAEAQVRIAELLRKQKRDLILNEAVAELVRTSYVWYKAELADFMKSIPGLERGQPSEQEL